MVLPKFKDSLKQLPKLQLYPPELLLALKDKDSVSKVEIMPVLLDTVLPKFKD